MGNLKSAIVLAGGLSSRMTFDKQFIMLKEKKLIFEIAKNLEKHFEEIIIVTNKIEYYKGCKYKLVSDEIKNSGPLAGISVGLENSRGEFIYIVACDMPNIDDSYINYMKNKINKDINFNKNYDAYLVKENDKMELFHGFYKRSLGQEIKDYLINGTRKSIISFFERSNKYISFVNDEEFESNNFDRGMFINLNTKEELISYEENYSMWV
ncbi:MAG: molybdenum cofactor guanylyltransferase [Peptostreptococcaceae bacterium]